MLILIISLFSLYDLLSCVDYENRKFNESLLIEKHHQNFLQIKKFINEAQHRFRDEANNGLESTRHDELLNHSITKWWWDNTSSIDQLGLKTPQTFLLPIARSQPLFPISITPYTTELNNRHLSWDEIFSVQNIYTRTSESRLRNGPDITIPPKNPSLSQVPQPKDQKIFGPTIQPPKLHIYSRPLHPNPALRSNTSLRGYPVHDFEPNTTLITPNEEYKKIWLQEITTYTPIERWFKTLATPTGMTLSYDYTKLDPETLAPSSRKSRRFHSKARKRKRHHDSYKRYKERQIFQKNRYRHPDYSNGHIHRRRKHRIRGIKKVTRPSENRRHRDPTEPPNALLQYSEHDDTEDGKLFKYIERRDELDRKTAKKDKTAFYHKVKEILKQAESKKKAKILKLKAELLRKIVEGSSYSDEEASLTKNLIKALQNGNRTFKHNVARNNRDAMKRITR